MCTPLTATTFEYGRSRLQVDHDRAHRVYEYRPDASVWICSFNRRRTLQGSVGAIVIGLSPDADTACCEITTGCQADYRPDQVPRKSYLNVSGGGFFFVNDD
jgi:hypothetical protein